jgi:putative hemolysin
MQSKIIFSALLILILAGAGCTGKTQNSNTTQNTTSTSAVDGTKDDEIAKDTALSNPATVYCLSQGGKFSMRKTLDGSTQGICELPNNIQCDEWAYYRGECPTGAKQQSATSTSDTTATTTSMAQTTSTPDISPTPTQRDDDKEEQDSQTSKLELKAEVGEPGEIVTSWKMNGLKSPGGFIVILSGKPGITDLGKYSHANNNPDSRSFTWNNLVAGRTYYFKVCTNVDGQCGEMSNEVSAIAE